MNNRYSSACFRRLCVVASVVIAAVSIGTPASAHEGHAGAMTPFMEEKDALKTMLPEDAKVAKRKQELDKESVQWAAEFYGIDLPEGVQTYYLARDKTTDAILGAAIVSEVEYRHGKVRVAIGIDAAQNVTKAAVLGINEKYVQDLAGTIGTGFIDRYAGVSLIEFTDATNERVAKQDAGQIVEQELRKDGILLVTLLRKVAQQAP